MIGLLTGTFNPIHLGHVELAKAAIRARSFDEVWLLVNADPEHKERVAPYVHRLSMAKLAVSDEPRMKVYQGPLAQRPHMMGTFEDLMSAFPKERFVFIVGMDTIVRLDRWQRRESVVKNASYAVAHRPGSEVTELERMKGRLGVLADELELNLFDFEDHGAASSTAVREQMEAGEQPESLDGRIYDYALENSLYRHSSPSAQ